MSNNHFNYFRVKNFKRFKDLEVKDIGQFNLVLGDNNVGKTSLLEGLLFEEDIDAFMGSLAKTLYIRKVFGTELTGGVWELFVNKDEFVKLNDFVITEFVLDSDGNKRFPLAFYKRTKEILLRNDAAKFDEFLNEEKFQKKRWEINNPKNLGWIGDFAFPLISSLDGNEERIAEYYSRLINQGARSLKIEFIRTLRTIDESLISLDFDTSTVRDRSYLSVESENSDGRILLHLQGDGFKSLFRIILFLILFRSKRLMIDEIDAGIHYSRMKEYWKVILQSAKENDVQIFATTHNRECIQYFIEALEELGEEYKDRARAINLVENQSSKEVTSVTSKFNELEHTFLAGNEVR